jgi:hypothetical protein
MTRTLVLAAFIASAGCTAPPEVPPSPPIGERAKENSQEVPLPEDLFRRIDHEMAELPQGAEKELAPDELERLKRLRETRRGTSEDKEFLEKRILGDAIPWLKKEAEEARARREATRPKDWKDGPLDLVTMQDGRQLRGRVEEATEEQVRVRSKFGSIKIPRAQVTKIEYGAGGDPK